MASTYLPTNTYPPNYSPYHHSSRHESTNCRNNQTVLSLGNIGGHPPTPSHIPSAPGLMGLIQPMNICSNGNIRRMNDATSRGTYSRQSLQQKQHQHGGNLFTSPIPPQPPATPSYTHVQTNKENHLQQSSPYYGNTSSFGITGFKPGVTGRNVLHPIGSMHATQNNGIGGINQQQPKKQIINTANMTLTVEQKQINVGGDHINNNNNNNNNQQQERIRAAELKQLRKRGRETREAYLAQISPKPKRIKISPQTKDENNENKNNIINNELQLRKMEVIKHHFHLANNYSSSKMIYIGDDYQSKEEYSKKRIISILNEIDNIKSTFPDPIINIIAEFSHGRIICCAECEEEDFHIDCDDEIDKVVKDKILYSHCRVLTENDINDVINNNKELTRDMKFEISIGNKYIIICNKCISKSYCSNPWMCLIKCIDNIDSKICKRCKNIYCKDCSSQWQNHEYGDNIIICASCQWVIKTVKERNMKVKGLMDFLVQ